MTHGEFYNSGVAPANQVASGARPNRRLRRLGAVVCGGALLTATAVGADIINSSAAPEFCRLVRPATISQYLEQGTGHANLTVKACESFQDSSGDRIYLQGVNETIGDAQGYDAFLTIGETNVNEPSTQVVGGRDVTLHAGKKTYVAEVGVAENSHGQPLPDSATAVIPFGDDGQAVFVRYYNYKMAPESDRIVGRTPEALAQSVVNIAGAAVSALTSS